MARRVARVVDPILSEIQWMNYTRGRVFRRELECRLQPRLTQDVDLLLRQPLAHPVNGFLE